MKTNRFYKKLKIIVVSQIVVGISCATIFLSGCSINPVYSTTNPSGIKFISERSFALKFEGTDKSEISGTGWLISQDVNDSNQYYLGTNLHVASAINNSIYQRETHEYSSNGVYLEKKEQTIFDTLYIGQVTSKIDNDYLPGYIDGANDYETDYYSSLKIENNNISVAWTPFETFNNMNLIDPYHVYNNMYVENGTMDFAVLKIDFSKVNKNGPTPFNLENINSKPIDKALAQFEKEPTKFANGYSNKEAITIGGFPATIKGEQEWKSIINTYSNERYYGLMLDKSQWKKGIENIDDSVIKKHYVLASDIKYLTDDYACKRNIANQLIFNDLGLNKGSSGSMAINANNEVVGIFWGTYSLSNNQQKSAIDLFKSFSTENISAKFNDLNNKSFIISKQYDVINDFNTSINSTLKNIK